MSLNYVDQKNQHHAPISGLYHEFYHIYLRFKEAKEFNAAKTREQKQQAKVWMKKMDAWSSSPTGIPGYMNNEEYFVTQKTIPFQTKIGEQAPPNHRGEHYKTKGIFSKEPANGIWPKFKRKFND